MAAAAALFSAPRLLGLAEWLAARGGRLVARGGRIRSLPFARAWTGSRDLPAPALPSFRSWWRRQQ
jgi:L-lactate dehydrogenase complex protein LldF